MADTLILAFVLLFLAIAWLTIRWTVDILVNRAAKRRRMAEPETYGDEGGMPYTSPEPETGSGLLAGDKSK